MFMCTSENSLAILKITVKHSCIILDVELESENSLTSSPRQARKNITLKLKSEKIAGRGRPRKGKSSKLEDQDLATGFYLVYSVFVFFCLRKFSLGLPHVLKHTAI